VGKIKFKIDKSIYKEVSRKILFADADSTTKTERDRKLYKTIHGKPHMKNKQPNILFFLPDQHRPDWLGYNTALPLRTPNIDRLCEQGIRFTNAFTPSPLCSPARACLATGRDYHRCGVENNHQRTPLSFPTYYRHLRDAGYEVASVGKLDLHKPDRDWGLDGSNLLREYGFSYGIDNEGKGDAISSYCQNRHSPKGPYMQFLKENNLAETHLAMYEPHTGKPGMLNFPAVTELPDSAYCDNWIADNGMQFLREFPHDNPWHLVVNFAGPHGPFDVTAEMRSQWENVEFPVPVDNHEADAETIAARRQNYAAMIENIDTHVGRMVDLVRQRGEWENTIIVYASDHGEMLGDHGRWAKSIWYTPATGVPLIVSGPGIRSGDCSDALVSLHDLAATFLDYARAKPLPDADTRTLRGNLEGRDENHRGHIVSALNEWRMIFDGRYKCVIGANPSPMLFDTREDPHEMRNCAETHPHIATRLADTLACETRN
jgi:arylsulfatase A-like enzyme